MAGIRRESVRAARSLRNNGVNEKKINGRGEVARFFFRGIQGLSRVHISRRLIAVDFYLL